MESKMSKNVVAMEKPQTISSYLSSNKIKARLAQALGKKANIEEFLSNVLIEIGRSDDLKACSYDSILQCAIDSANFGLVPNKTLGHAWLIPYNNYNKATKKSTKEAQLQIGYKGYIKKFLENGMNVEVETVTNEEIEKSCFEEIRGSDPKITHKPIRTEMRTEENIALAYAIGRKKGFEDIIEVMGVEDIKEAAKQEFYDTSAKKKVRQLKGAWISKDRLTDFGEMCRKTVLRRLAKFSGIDVVQKMSSYEGERDKVLKDVTPRDNSDIQEALTASQKQNETQESNKLTDLLEGSTEEVRDPSEVFVEGFIGDVQLCQSSEEIDTLKKQKEGNINVLDAKQLNELNKAIEQRKAELAG